MKKALCLFLCALLLLGVLVSCGGTDEPDPAVTTTGPSGDSTAESNDNSDTNENTESGSRSETAENSGTTASQPTSPAYVSKTTPTHEPEDFGDSMGNPRDYTMLARPNRTHYLFGTEDSTSAVQKAAYKRNLILEDMYNVSMKVVTCPIGEHSAGAQSFNSMLAVSSGEYDLAVTDFWWETEFAGHLLNIMTVSEINEADDWWVQGWNDNLIINNRMYTIVGDASLELYENIEIMFYNKAIEEEYDYDLYQTFMDGKWTIDEMIYTIDVFKDAMIDNDPDNDVYGAMYDIHSVRSHFYAAGVTMLQTNRNNGIITVIANTSKNINVADKITELCHHTATLFQPSRTARGADISSFLEGKAFTYTGCLFRGTEIKAANTVFDYGLMMLPKYEEADDYRSTSYAVSVFGLPATCRNTHMSAVVLETMNWLSDTEEASDLGEDRLVYTYYNTVLKGQVANSPQDVVVLDMSRELAYYDFGFVIYTKTGILDAFQKAVVDDYSVSTVMDSIISAADQGLTDVVEFYNK